MSPNTHGEASSGTERKHATSSQGNHNRFVSGSRRAPGVGSPRLEGSAPAAKQGEKREAAPALLWLQVRYGNHPQENAQLHHLSHFTAELEIRQHGAFSGGCLTQLPQFAFSSLPKSRTAHSGKEKKIPNLVTGTVFHSKIICPMSNAHYSIRNGCILTDFFVVSYKLKKLTFLHAYCFSYFKDFEEA